jgi:hypothetical protein
MIAVVLAALILVPILRWLHLHEAWIEAGGFTIRF